MLDMGEPIRIVDLAVRMIELSGFTVRDSQNPTGDIAIEYIGLRPGEKLYEELLIGDHSENTIHPKIKKGNEPFLPWDKLEIKLTDLKKSVEINDVVSIIEIMKDLVSGYVFSDPIVDLAYQENNKFKINQEEIV